MKKIEHHSLRELRTLLATGRRNLRRVERVCEKCDSAVVKKQGQLRRAERLQDKMNEEFNRIQDAVDQIQARISMHPHNDAELANAVRSLKALRKSASGKFVIPALNRDDVKPVLDFAIKVLDDVHA